jgi:hypothetical protein
MVEVDATIENAKSSGMSPKATLEILVGQRDAIFNKVDNAVRTVIVPFLLDNFMADIANGALTTSGELPFYDVFKTEYSSGNNVIEVISQFLLFKDETITADLLQMSTFSEEEYVPFVLSAKAINFDDQA